MNSLTISVPRAINPIPLRGV